MCVVRRREIGGTGLDKDGSLLRVLLGRRMVSMTEVNSTEDIHVYRN